VSRKRKSRFSSTCTTLRTRLVRNGTFNIVTGKISEGEATWVTEPCGTPLFDDAQRATGICRSCAEGWTHPENFPAVVKKGREK
jgi:hypothetical protein